MKEQLPSNNESRINLKHKWIFAGILIAGILLRFVGLGEVPLSESEARLAYHVFHPEETPLISAPLYTAITSILFWFFGATNFLARFFPALMGTLLIFLPLFLEKERQDGSALWIAFWLAIDPALIAVSRQVNLQIILLTTFLFSLVFLWKKKFSQGFFWGLLAVFSSPLIFHLIIPVFLSILIAIYLFGMTPTKIQWKEFSGKKGWLIFLVVTLLISAFMIVPKNLGLWTNFLPEYLQAWKTPTGLSFPQILYALVGYELSLVFFAFLGFFNFFKKSLSLKVISLTAGIVFLWVLIFPGKEIIDLIFPIPFLAYLAGTQFKSMLHGLSEKNYLSYILGAILIAILFYISQIIVRGVPAENIFMKVLPIVIPILLASILTMIVAWETTLSTALNGIYWAVGVFLIFISVFSVFRITSPQNYKELWISSGQIQEEKAMRAFLQDVEQWRKDHATPLIVVSPSTEFAWRWFFRDYQVASSGVDSLKIVSPDIAVLPFENVPNDLGGYRGRSFRATQQVIWNLLSPEEWFNWLISRDLPDGVLQKRDVVVLVNESILPEQMVIGENNLNQASGANNLVKPTD